MQLYVLKMQKRLAFCLLASALAQATQLPGTNITYYPQNNQATGHSSGYFLVAGFRARDVHKKHPVPSATLRVQCSDQKMYDFQIYFVANDNLLTEREYSSGAMPTLTFRVGKNYPRTVKTLPLNKENGKPSLNTLKFSNYDNVRLDWALSNEPRHDVYINVNKSNGVVLKYVFDSTGFMTALKNINTCK